MPLRLRSVRVAPAVDGVRLRAEIAEATGLAGTVAEKRARLLQCLQGALRQGRSVARQRLEAGAGGIETAQRLACLTDDVVGALYDHVVSEIFPTANPTKGEQLTVMAVGGYGRGAMAPFSDIDLLFLRPYKSTAHAENVIEYMLYALWDLGFKVGHASRTVDECLRIAREDMTVRTALLEARRLCGDEALAGELKRRFRREVVQGTGAAFVAAKLAERDRRYVRAGASRYMVEPNVKEGKGALRDLNTLFWIAQYLHPSDTPSEIVRLEAFTGRELKAFIRAFDFLWATRCFLHFVSGRAEERLTFDIQPEIARCMGYGDYGQDARSVERFMRRYFLIAREVGSLTRTFCAKLEAEHEKKPQGLSRFLPRRGAGRRRALEAGFQDVDGRLAVEGPEIFERDPTALIRLFHIADRENLDIHPDAFAAVTRSLNLIGAKLRRDDAAARAFLDLLAHGRNTQRALMLMSEAGVLGRYLPEFGRIVGQMQFNMYHAYTTDEHTLRAVGVIADIAAGRLADEHPLAVSIMPLIGDREALFLAMLLHDTGKGGAPGGQALAGARNARQACERLGLSDERIEVVAWLVQHHLVMSDFAQKRDVGDARTVMAFARIVENPERLRLLAILTAADIRAVGPGVWNGWKAQLLRSLYTSAEALFRGGRPSDLGEEHVDSERRALAARARAALAASRPDPELGAWADAMEDAYMVGFSAKAQAAHFALAGRAVSEGAAASAGLSVEGYAAEVVVAARDRRGLFADLCGVMARLGANIAGARVYTSASGQALDVFYVRDQAGEPYGRDSARGLERLAQALEAAARGAAPALEPARLDVARTAAFAVATSVVVDNDASAKATVVEITGRDRPGLLQALARTLADAGLSVHSAHVENYGERAVDAFYVVDANGLKIHDPTPLQALRVALTSVLLEAEPEVRRARERVRAGVGATAA